MTVKIGINGFGRIGRQALRAINERHPHALEVVAVNDLFDPATNAHLLKYDSTYGKYPGTVEVKDGHLVVDGKTILDDGRLAILDDAAVQAAVGP